MAEDIQNPEDPVEYKAELRGAAAMDEISADIDINKSFIVIEEEQPDGTVRNLIVGNAPEDEEEEEKVTAGKDPNDNRVRVKKATDYPYSANGLLIMKYKNNKKYAGTGTSIDSKHILTAGHNVYDKKLGWAKSIAFQPGRNGEKSPPLGSYATDNFMSFHGWTVDKDRDWDMGMLILDKAMPSTVGCTGIKVLEDEDLKKIKVTVAGYPGDKDRGVEQWEDTGPIDQVSPERIKYKAFTARGDSGAGVINDVKTSGTKYQYATHIGFVDEYPKTGCRVSQKKKKTLDKYLKPD